MEFVFRRTYRGPLKAVVFDWAGTTVDYGCFAPAGVFVEVFKRKQIAITMEQAREPMGTQKKVHIQKVAQMEPVARQWEEVHGRPCGEDDVEEMYREFIPLQLACLPDFGDLVPGTLEVVADLRRRGMKIGSSTGYNREMLEVVLQEAKKRGFEPDSALCTSDVSAGRPAPWMCFQNVVNLGVYPMESTVKVGDTVPDVEEGLNAGMWTIAVVMCGNEIGLTEEQIAALDPSEREARRSKAQARLTHAGAHYVVDSTGDILPILDEIQSRVAGGEKP